jgi:hypothetical protein
MAIIYSYSKANDVRSTDTFIISRFNEEDLANPRRTMSVEASTLADYFYSNMPVSTLNEVLAAGNESLLDAKVGSVYLYDTSSPAGYLSVRASKNRIYFDGKNDVTYGHITQDTLFLQDSSSIYGFNIKKPSSLIANRTATFQDATGIVAYLDDISSLTLDQVLDNGNTSLSNAFINELGLYDVSNSKYWGLVVDDSTFFIYDINAAEAMLETNGSSITLYGNYASSINNYDLTDNRVYNLPDKDGIIALTSDIPAALLTANYGLAAQIDRSADIVNTTVESSLIGDYEGTLSVPANAFTKGSSFKASLIGHINCLGSATLRIRIKTETGVLLAETGVMDLDAANGKHWKLDVEFTVREIGGEGSALIASGGSFVYNRNGSNNPEGFTFVNINENDFDTTIANELVITAQWNNASASNAIYSDIFTLNKVY